MFQDSVYKSVENQWVERAYQQALQPGTKTYRKAEVEFFCGAMSALSQIDKEGGMHPRWVIALMSGRPVVSD